MAKLIATVKAVVTRLIFAAHGLLAIWQVTIFKRDSHFWYLSAPVLLLFFEGIFTLTIKRNQEWKWFCPSVFLYLASVVPAIWLLELDKLEKKQRARQGIISNSTTAEGLQELDQLLGPHVQLSALSISADTWLTLIEQFLMLILILGRWMLPKGDLTRDQLSQLLLVYIGTAADIIEFFDAFQDETIGGHPILTALTLAIWSWSLLQFTVVLTATKSSRRSRISAPSNTVSTKKKKRSRANQRHGLAAYCCSVDVWAIIINILLQDAPFVTFRLLLICYYRIISYMNVFFTCKNTLVIALQLYRLYVVYAEKRAANKKFKCKSSNRSSRESPDISLILSSLDPAMQQYYSDIEGAVRPMKRARKTAKGTTGRSGGSGVACSASCSELVSDLGGGVNPASNLRLTLVDDTLPIRRERRKSVSADNLKGSKGLCSDDEEYEADALQEAAPASSGAEDLEDEDAERSLTPQDEPESSLEDDLLAELTPAQINILRAAANKRSAAAALRGVRHQDTGYSTASSSHGSARTSKCTASSTSISTRAKMGAKHGAKGRRVHDASVNFASRSGGRRRGTSAPLGGRSSSRQLQLLQGDERV